jgi:glycosyltransferase involved in cell wall biosynthesis
MKVVVITNLFPSPVEPMRSTFNEEQVLALSQVTRIVGVIVPIDWRRAFGVLRSGRRSELRGGVNWKGVSAVYPTYFHLPRIAGWLNGVLMFLALLPAWLRLRRHRPEAIFVTWAFPDGFAAVLLGILSGLRVVVKVHGTDVEVLARAPLRRTLAVWALNRATVVVSVSKYLQRRLVEFGVAPNRVVVAYNGIDRERFRPMDRGACRRELGLEEEGRVVVYVGNLKRDKGVMDLLNAAGPLARDGGVSVVFVGDGIMRGELERRVAELGIEAYVRITGRVSHDLVPVWINSADLLCLPSHHEGVPNVILEAAACGIPSVATAVGGLPEVVTPANGRLVPAGNAPALREMLREVLGQEWDRATVQAALHVGSWAENANRIAAALDGTTP